MSCQLTQLSDTDTCFDKISMKEKDDTNKIEVPRDARNSKSGNITSSGENGLNIRTHSIPKWDRTGVPMSKHPLFLSDVVTFIQ